MKKPSLTFYTNIPTPYQESFFNELSKLFLLKVVYYSVSEANREWKFDFKVNYEIVILKDNAIAHFIQRWVFDFHFSWQIFPVVWKDKSDYRIVGGSYAATNASVALLLSRLRRKKVIYFSESLFEVRNPFKYVIKWLYLRILSICCDAVFCIGKKAAESFKAYGIRSPKFIIPYNIDEGSFVDLRPEKLRDYELRYKSNKEIVILSSGALVYRKGMDILIKAVRKIDCDNIRLVIIGNGPQKEELLALCNHDKRITLEGFVTPDELPYYFATADIFAFASRYDGWAVVINEAIAANVPIISSNKVGAAVELLTSDELGVLCQSEDVDDFKQALESLIYDNHKRGVIKTASQSLIPLISSRCMAERTYDILINKLAQKSKI